MLENRNACNPNGWRSLRSTICIASLFLLPACLSQSATVLGQNTPNSMAGQRQLFQNQQVIPSRFGGWIFQVGNTPRLIWRDVDEVRRLGGAVEFQVRWFDTELNESAEPDHPGRWMAWVEGIAPNGTPLRRSFTFFVAPQKIEPTLVPDLTVLLPNFPGPDAPPAWGEYQAEFDRTGKDLLTRGLIDNEKGAILIAGISEAKPLGRPRRFVESTVVANSDYHLALKMQLQGAADRPRLLQSARIVSDPAPVLRAGPAKQAGVPENAKSVIDQFCNDWVEATGEPFVTLVARNGVIITHEAFGKDRNGNPVDRNYRCWLASITKTVSALMFGQFVDQELISLDASLATVFPDFPQDDPHVPTFRQCLNHTSGLSGHGDFGGMNNPHLENVVLNGIDVNEPGKAHVYSGLGFELAAKAMEMASGKSAVRLYDEHLFQPLGFGDVVLGNASSDCELTARELATLGQLIANQGRYGDREFFTSSTFQKLLPRALNLPDQPNKTEGLGMHWVRHQKPDTPANSSDPADYCFSQQTVGHGSLSGCILMVDLEQNLVIAQVRRKFHDGDSTWWQGFFQVVARATSQPSR